MNEKKAPKPKTKKFFYRRAVWDGQTSSSPTLEQILADVHSRLPEVEDRIFRLASGSEMKGAHFTHEPEGLFIQVAYYVPGGATSTISKNMRGRHAVITAEPAPEGKDYLDGDVFILVKGNHVLLCPSNVRETLVRLYFYNMLVKGEESVAGSLVLESVGKANKVKLLNEEGVKEIRLNSSLYAASLHDMQAKNSKATGLIGVVAEKLKQAFSEDRKLNEIRESENLNIRLSISFDGREAYRNRSKVKNFGEVGLERLLKTSKQIVKESDAEEEDTGFVIITTNGSVITPSSIKVFEVYSVATLGKSLDRQDAYNKLLTYYDYLRQTGALSQ